MDAIIEQGSGFSGRDSRRRLVHRRDGHARVGVAAGVPPQNEHHGEGNQREKYNWVASDKPEQFGKPAGFLEGALWDVDIDRHATAHG